MLSTSQRHVGRASIAPANPIIIKKNQIHKLQKNCGICGDADDNSSMKSPSRGSNSPVSPLESENLTPLITEARQSEIIHTEMEPEPTEEWLHVKGETEKMHALLKGENEAAMETLYSCR